MPAWLDELAARVHQGLRHERQVPSRSVIQTLLQIMYFSSLRTEESQPISFHIVYLDPDNPDPSPPERIVQDRWSCLALERRVPFEVSQIAKLATASDPRSSSLAVFHNSDGALFIWGLVDQGNNYFDFVHYGSESGPERPGLFQASVIGVGHVSVYRGYELLADFNVNELRAPPIDVLKEGPVRAVLEPGIRRYLGEVSAEVAARLHAPTESELLHTAYAEDWPNALRRLLLRIRQYRHGGAVLITPDAGFADLNVKFGVSYARLRTCLKRRAAFKVLVRYASNDINHRLDNEATSVPVSLYFDEGVAEIDVDETRTELEGIVWFISLLSRVDGVVVLTPDLEVRGFGVEIQTDQIPQRVVHARNALGSPESRSALDYQHLGTRHRSVMRYCASTPGAVGFVVSQDGDVRAMTLVDSELVVWENVKLRYDDFDRRHSRKVKR